MRRKFAQAEQVRWSGWLFASIGLVFLSIGGELAYSQGKTAKSQPSLTHAQVVTSRVHRYVRTGNGAGMKSNEVTLDETYYELIAEFRYSVEGRSFLSPAAENVRKSNQINQTLAQYSPGSWHQITYDSHDPSDIHIHDWPDQVSPRTWVFVSLGLGLVFLLIGGLLISASRSQGVQASALGSYQLRFRLRH